MSTLNKEAYHHGDLRKVLLAKGVELLMEEGVDKLSLRSLAKRAGVSHNAPYQHFADKEAFLAAIAQQGFQLLTQAIHQSQETINSMSFVPRVEAAASAYVHFAWAHPGHLGVMFGKLAHQNYPFLIADSSAALDALVQIVEEGQQRAEVNPHDANEIALMVWSAMHGLASILIAGKVPPRFLANGTPDVLTGKIIGLLCEGILRTS